MLYILFLVTDINHIVVYLEDMMNPERKEIIMNEIKHWKKSKLLPEHYCDFLLTLYSEGDEQFEPEQEKAVAKFKLLSVVFVQICLLLSVVVIYFTDFFVVMQIGICVLFIGITIFAAYKMASYSVLLSHFYYLVAAIILFLLMVYCTSIMFVNNQIAMGAVIFFTCIVWLTIGLKWKMSYFTIAGIGGFLLFALFLTLN